MSRLANILVWVLLVAYLGISLAFTESRLDDRIIRYINIAVADSLKTRFIQPEDVIDQLRSEHFRITGMPVDSVNRDAVRLSVLKMHEIRDAQVFSTPDGILHIRIWQKDPVVRLIGNNRSFYLDELGDPLELSDKYAAEVLIITGVDDAVWARQNLFEMVKYIRQDAFLSSLIQQIHLFPDHTMEIIPRVGDHRIFFGYADQQEWKLEKLKAFYRQGLPSVGWNQYESIDLRYSNQVVAKRKTDV